MGIVHWNYSWIWPCLVMNDVVLNHVVLYCVFCGCLFYLSVVLCYRFFICLDFCLFLYIWLYSISLVPLFLSILCLWFFFLIIAYLIQYPRWLFLKVSIPHHWYWCNRVWFSYLFIFSGFSIQQDIQNPNQRIPVRKV